MNGRRNSKYFSINILFVFFLLILSSNAARGELTIAANHDHINIDFFYHGSTVSVSGTSDGGTDLVIKITSPEGREELKQKGKVAGLLWMNTGTLHFDHVPNLYFLYSTRKVDEILSAGELEKYVIGYPSLEKHIEIEPVKEDEKAKWFNEFVRFKEASKLYSTSSGRIRLTPGDGKLRYYIMTDWPYQAPPGEYVVTVYAVKDKKVVEKAEARVLVEQTGIVKTLSHMARNNGAVYGVLSIIAAIGAGFGVGMVFRKSGGAH